ncbi:MAG: hypothetical protein L6Q84_35620 [Polyangiaceae bacterium]|nr:hypothetical protein [Polyangiaceae bacterium]
MTERCDEFTITFLQPAPGYSTSKTITRDANGELRVEAYNAGTHFAAEQVRCATITELAAELEARRDGRWIAVRGQPRADLDLGRLYADERLEQVAEKRGTEVVTIGFRDNAWLASFSDGTEVKTAMRRNKTNFAACSRRLVMMDADKVVVRGADLVHDLIAAVKGVIAKLPSYFHDVSVYVQLSSRAGLDPEGPVKVHLWFLSDRAIPDAEWKRLVKLCAPGFDGGVFDPIQPLYFTDPTFVGMPDPLPQRTLLIEGTDSEVRVPENWPELAAAELLAKHWPREGSRHKAQLALAGGLLGMGLGAEVAERLLREVCRLAQDEGPGSVVSDTEAKTSSGQKVTSWRQLAKLLTGANVPEVIAAVRELLGSSDDDDQRPEVFESAELHENVEAAVAALAADESLYKRAGELVTVTRVSAGDAEASNAPLPEGAPQVRSIGVPTLRERLTCVARFRRFDKRSESFVATRPSDALVQAVLARGDWPLPPLVGVLEAPTLRPDGTVLAQPGYDTRTGYLYVPSATFPSVPDNPSYDDAQEALATLAEPFLDFPYARGPGANGDGREANYTAPGLFAAIAAIMTLVLRPGIRGAVPTFVYDAVSPLRAA